MWNSKNTEFKHDISEISKFIRMDRVEGIVKRNDQRIRWRFEGIVYGFDQIGLILSNSLTTIVFIVHAHLSADDGH
jgi:hypothetical protein